MRLASVSECREIDALAQSEQSEYGISGDTLMERAGELSAKIILEKYQERLRKPGFVALICGPGGNGGDGLVTARHLALRGVEVKVFLTDAESPHSLFQKNLSRLRDLLASSVSDAEASLKALPVSSVKSFDADSVTEIAQASIIVDALFGVGLSRKPEGADLLAIKIINSSDGMRVSLDVPSGLDADRGMPLGEAVTAHLTLTFGIAKRGFAVNEGPQHIGELQVLDIGFPLDLVKSVASSTLGFDRRLARKFLPRRKSSGNKSTYGNVAVFAGSKGMGGAAVLCGTAAARVGAGYVTVITNGNPKEVLSEAPEFLTADLDDEGIFAQAKWTSAVVGPGLGSRSGEVLEKLKAASDRSLVIDADALSALAKRKDQRFSQNTILTPHAGELSRLLGVDAKTIESDRFRYAMKAAKKFGCIVLLKGYRTVVCNGDKSVAILSGNAALAKAGMGDVLAGMIAGFLAQGLKPFAATCLAAFVHGSLADEWLRSGRDILSLQPSDVSASLPFVLKQLRSLADQTGSGSR